MTSSRHLILGINSVFHESSACIFDGARLLAFVEEERLTRIKKAKRAAVDNAHELPVSAIEYCLAEAQASWEDIALIGYSYDPGLRGVIPGDDVVPGDWGSETGEAAFQLSVRRVPQALSELAGTDVTERFRWVPHHLAHAASSYFASPYDDAAILSVDGIGEQTTTMLAHGRGGSLQVIDEFRYPHSLGFLWEQFSLFLGMDQYSGPAKLMGLAGFGRPEPFAAELARIVTRDGDSFRIDNHWTRFRAAGDRLEELFGPRRAPGAELDGRDADIAAALQATTEAVLGDLVARLRWETAAPALCLTGGVALNCVANGKIVRESGFEHVFVPPVASDSGGSLGAALYLLHHELDSADRFVLSHPYLGPSYDETALKAALADAGLDYAYCPDIAGRAAGIIAGGGLVGWFQGAAEIGPRALGNRSILADPRKALVKDEINLYAKHREYWRPFSPSFLAEHAPGWLETGAESPSHGFMSFTYPVLPQRRHEIPAVVHADGCVRGQLVTADLNPRYHELISAFHERTGVPAVLNTSFNDPHEPIVSSPEDAVRTYRNSRLSALALGDYLVVGH
jgi:carbamoyltransferase